jgi:anti-anti-sigma factor
MENFLNIRKGDIIVEVVNLSKATKEEADEFKTILTRHIEEGSTKLIVDLHQCEFVDSTFLSTLLIALKAVMKKDGSLKIASPKNDVAEVLEATGMTRVFDVHSSISKAIDSFKKNESSD